MVITEGEKLATSQLKRAWKKEYVQLIATVAILLLLVLVFWLGIQFALHSEYPALSVASGSMCMLPGDYCDGWSHPFEHTLHVGDLIIVQGASPDDIHAAPYPDGDIIVFHSSSSNDLIVHRAIKRTEKVHTIFNDAGSTFWVSASGTGSDDTVEKTSGQDSYQVDLHLETLDTYHDFVNDHDFSKEDLVRIWIWGANTSSTIRLEFWTEKYANRTNGYFVQLADDFSGWKKFEWGRTKFASIGSPKGWNAIGSIRLVGNADIQGTLRFDELDSIQLELQTKGDGNSGPDPNVVVGKDLVGKVVMRIPWLGHIALFTHTRYGLYMIALVIVLLVVAELVYPEVAKRRRGPNLEQEPAKGEGETKAL